MVRSCIRHMGILTYAVVLVAGVVAVTWKPMPLPAQQASRCFIVACTGNVCVWEEIKCPKPVEPT